MAHIRYSGMRLTTKAESEYFTNLHLFLLTKKSNQLKQLNFRYEYELIVVPGLTLNDSIPPIIKTKVKKSPISINPQGKLLLLLFSCLAWNHFNCVIFFLIQIN